MITDRASIEHLQNEDEWRFHPVQPMKREQLVGRLETGIVVAGVLSVYEINMFELTTGTLRSQLEGVPHTDYASYRAMVEAGWHVD
jgi:hypothetical protein